MLNNCLMDLELASCPSLSDLSSSFAIGFLLLIVEDSPTLTFRLKVFAPILGINFFLVLKFSSWKPFCEEFSTVVVIRFSRVFSFNFLESFVGLFDRDSLPDDDDGDDPLLDLSNAVRTLFFNFNPFDLIEDDDIGIEFLFADNAFDFLPIALKRGTLRSIPLRSFDDSVVDRASRHRSFAILLYSLFLFSFFFLLLGAN